MSFLATMALAGLAAAGCAGAQAPCERTFRTERIEVGPRRRLAPRTMLFAETITHYGLFQNYLHMWIDRPLFWDRRLRHAPDTFVYDTCESFRVTRREAMKYGLDGLGVFGNYGSRLKSFRKFCGWNADAAAGGFAILPIVLYAESGIDYVPDAKDFADLVKAAQESACVPEIGGRRLIASYNARMMPPAAHRKLSEGIRAAVGNDRYMLMGEIEARGTARLQKAFRANGRLTDAEMKECERLVTDALDVSDGLHLRLVEYVRPADGPYASHVDTSFFDTCLKPVLLDVYARPQYAGKALGFYVMQGYINHMSGMNHGEDGTETLRRSMASALALNPDFIVFFEWNEQNENTMFQPTVYSGQTVGRIIRHYASRLRGEPPAPYAGDDPSVPSLVLSHRVTCTPGETLFFEVLNIPAGEKAASHDVRLSLAGPDGAELAAFPHERMDTPELAAATFSLPAASLPVGMSVSPRLTVDGVEYGGFHPLRVDPTFCRNFKCVRQSLRDLPKMGRGGFTARRGTDGACAFSADLAAGEPLASVELVCNEDEADAFDPSREYDRAKHDILRLVVSCPPGKGGNAPVELRLRNAPGALVKQDWKANINPALKPLKEPGAYRLHTYWWAAETAYFILLPKGCAAAAEIELRPDGKLGGGCAVIPARTVMERGAFAAVTSPERGFRVDATRFDALCDLPQPLGTNAVAWSGTARASAPWPSLHVRAVTEAGHVWRSPAVTLRPQEAGPKEPLNVFSEWAKDVRTIDVPSALIPEVDYAFTPDAGAALLPKNGDLRFAATLGGGNFYSDAFDSMRVYKDMPPDRDCAPAWVRDGAGWALRFDGSNDYVHLPIELFPLGPFRLRMEFRPEGCDVNRTLFRHAALWRGSLQLFLVKRRLYAMWAARELGDPKRSTGRFDTGLDVAEGEWNALEVSYDLRTLAFRLNGREKAFPYDRRGYVFRPSVFGGHNVTADIAPRGPLHFFKGELRKLDMRHNSAQGE